MKPDQPVNAFKMHFNNPIDFLLPSVSEYELINEGTNVKIRVGDSTYQCLISEVGGDFPNAYYMIKGKSNNNLLQLRIIESKHILDIRDDRIPKEMINGNGASHLLSKRRKFFFYFKSLRSALMDRTLKVPTSIVFGYVVGIKIFGLRFF